MIFNKKVCSCRADYVEVAGVERLFIINYRSRTFSTHMMRRNSATPNKIIATATALKARNMRSIAEIIV